MIDFDGNHYNRTNICHVCDKPISISEDERKEVIDQCHLTGNYKGLAHNNCNLNYIIPDFILVKIHNLTGCDSHLFIKELGFDESKIDVIPNTDENISFTQNIECMRFID